MSKLSTHVLDAAQGKPAADVAIELYAVRDGKRTLVKTIRTDANGRSPEALLSDDSMQQGRYELVFHAGDYFARAGLPMAEPRFIDKVTIAFGIANTAENYHVPLVMTPWSYSTYRGS